MKIKEKLNYLLKERKELIKMGRGMAVLEINELIHELKKKLKK